MNDNTKFDMTKFQKKLWGERLIVSEEVLDALIADHQEWQKEMIASMENVSLDALTENLSGMLATAGCDWYVEPANKTCACVEKLSKGFAMAATQMAEFFDDIYIGRDFKDVLLNPDQAPRIYPNTIVAAGGYFQKTVSQYLPEEFWTQSEELKNAKSNLELVGVFPVNEQVLAENASALICLSHAQMMSRVMHLIAEELSSGGHANLATIAASFAAKGEAMSKDIIAKAEAAISAGSSIDVINAFSTGPQGGTEPA